MIPVNVALVGFFPLVLFLFLFGLHNDLLGAQPR